MKFSTLLLLPALTVVSGITTTEEGEWPAYCNDLFVLNVEKMDFEWEDPNGADPDQMHLVEMSGADVKWGIAGRLGIQSGLSAKKPPGLPRLLMSADKVFLIGELEHQNYPIVRGGGIEGINLRIKITTDIEVFQFVYTIHVDETLNQGVCDYHSPEHKCADKITFRGDPQPLASQTTAGVKFEIDLVGFKEERDIQGPIINEFISQEKGVNSAFLYASLKLTDCPGGGGMGDPHFQTFNGHWYDFHGACDMHLVNAPNFAPAMPLTIDVRTSTRDWYSFIQNAVVQIGEDKLQIGGWGQYIFNGIDVGDDFLPKTISGYPISFTTHDKKTKVVEITIEGKERIVLRSFKDMISVAIKHADKARFHGSSGMMGDYETGQVYSRDGHVLIQEPNDIAKEWQIRDTESQLFQVQQTPQFPETCVMPNVQQVTGRLGKSVAQQAAKEACAHWSKDTQEGCMFDVMKTGDLDLAAVGAL